MNFKEMAAWLLVTAWSWEKEDPTWLLTLYCCCWEHCAGGYSILQNTGNLKPDTFQDVIWLSRGWSYGNQIWLGLVSGMFVQKETCFRLLLYHHCLIYDFSLHMTSLSWAHDSKLSISSMPFQNLSPGDVITISEGTRIMRVGLDGGKTVVAYGRPALEKCANLTAQVSIHLLYTEGLWLLLLKCDRQPLGVLKTHF